MVRTVLDTLPTTTAPAVAATAAGTPVSVVVPITERPESLTELYQEYRAPLHALGRTYEFIFIGAPWIRVLTAPLAELAARGEPIRILEVGERVSEAAMLKLAAERCHHPIVVTLPAYARVKASAILDLVAAVEQGADVVVARRWPRRDAWLNRLQNRAFHLLLRRLTGSRLNDVACGVRAMRREVLAELPLYGDFHRFLPLLAQREGYRVEEIPTPQHPHDAQPRVHRPGIYLRRLIDVLGLMFLLRFTDKPLRFFGLLGATLSGAGGLLLAFLLLERLEGEGIANRPLLLLSVLLLTLGVQAIALGLVGEIIVHLGASRRRGYRLLRER
ncbi:MAG TPA: hypothetical protein VNK43_02455 [Gemmatimonadales bacterium]|nr:hypothetical protein [Gemmatimonadales bacterium]